MITFWFFILYLIPFVLVTIFVLFVFKRHRPPGYKEGEIKHCSYCGAAISADRKFCGKCNKKQPTYGVLKPTY